VQVAHAQAELLVVLGEVLGHALGQRGHQHPLLALGPGPDLVEQVVDLIAGRADGDLGVHQPGGTDHLLGHRVAGQLHLVGGRRGRHVHRLAGDARELLEGQRPVVEGRGQPEAVLDERLLAGAVAVVHSPHLRDRHVALVDDDQRVLGQVLDQHGRRLARSPSGEVARVVLDPVAVAQLAEHLHVEQRALLQPLGFQQAIAAAQERQPLTQLLLHGLQRAVELLGGRHVVAGRVDVDVAQPFLHLPAQRIHAVDGVDRVAEQLDPIAVDSSLAGNTSTTSPRTRKVPGGSRSRCARTARRSAGG
jgi:hypothetical protein